MNNQPLVFEVRPSIHYDEATKKWYVATTLYHNGIKQKGEMYDLPFANPRRARQFARFLADQQEAHAKKVVVEKLMELGVLPGKKEDTPNG